MITKADKIVFGLIILLAIGAFFYLRNGKQALASGVDAPQETKAEKKGKKKADKAAHDSRVSISQKWDMPSDLTEISGIAVIGADQFACVQDELGKIFIFNTGSRKIEKQIPFGEAGDYEGIAVVDGTAYVIRADGRLFEISGYKGNKPSVRQHSTHLTAKHDVEGLCYDRKNNRLLLAIKGAEPGHSDFKGIYAFDLATKKLAAEPVFKVSAGTETAKGKKKGGVQPSDLEIHPETGDLYIVDGPEARLLVLGPDGAEKQRYELSNSDFPQPEGIAFSSAGELFISNEGKNGTGNIIKLTLSP